MDTKKIEELAIRTVEAHYTSFEVYRNKWAELYNRYQDTLRAGSITAETTTKTTLGQVYAMVEGFVSKMFSQPPRYRYVPRERKDVESAEKYDAFSQYQWEDNKADLVIEEIAKWGAICGLGGWKMGWKEQSVSEDKDGNSINYSYEKSFISNKKKKGEDSFANWYLEAIAPWDLIWTPTAKTLERDKMPVIGFRTKYSVMELESLGVDTNKYKQAIKGDQGRWRMMIDKYRTQDAVDQAISEMEVWCYELYVDFYNKNTTIDSAIVIAVGEHEGSVDAILDVRPNPYKKKMRPFGMYRPIKKPGFIPGFGVTEIAMPLVNSEEDLYNMALENLHTDIARPMEFVPSNCLQEEQLAYGARKLIPVRQLGASVNPLPTPTLNIGGLSYLFNYIERTKQNITSITDYQTGADKISGGQTLGEVRIMTAQSEQRGKKMLKSFEVDVLHPVGKLALQMNQQYLAEKPKLFYRVLGKDGLITETNLRFKDIEAVLDVSVVSGSSSWLQQGVETEKWQGIFAMGAQAMQMGVPVDMEEVTRRIIEEGYQIKDSETILPNLKERLKSYIQKKMAQIDDAKKESNNPMTARVLPTDVHEVHVKIHSTVLQAGGDEKPLSPEEMQMLMEHMNDHVRAMGGLVPTFAQAGEQLTSNAIQQPNGQQQAKQGGAGLPQNSGGTQEGMGV